MRNPAVLINSGVNKLHQRIKRYVLNHTRNIDIDKSCTIHTTAHFSLHLGGSIRIGEDTEVLNNVILATHGGNIKIGKRCSINPFTVIYGHGDTLIGNDVLIAGHCMVIPANHKFNTKDTPINRQGLSNVGIIIEDNVWIGHGCSILDGVNIASGCVIAAGSVVTSATDRDSVYAGIPARKIRSRGSKVNK